jgi:hypothetical protein
MNTMRSKKAETRKERALWTSLSDRQSAQIQGGKKIDLVYICTEKGCVVWNRYDMLTPGL